MMKRLLACHFFALLATSVEVNWSSCGSGVTPAAEWLKNFSWPALVPTFVNNDYFEVVTNTSSYEYCEAFRGILEHRNPDLKNGYAVFGDEGPKQPGLGGLSSYSVLKVRQGKVVYLYGILNQNDVKHDHAWFADETAIREPRVDFLTYSNKRMCMCWEQHHFIKCRLRPGTALLAGSGAWRNSTLSAKTSECDLKRSDGIIEIQNADPKYLQYVLDLKRIASECWIYDIFKDDLWESMHRVGKRVWPHPSRDEF